MTNIKVGEVCRNESGLMVGKINNGMKMEVWAITIYLCADKKLRLRSEIGNARKEGESAGERRRETSMFERGVDLFAVGRLAGGCWHSCI